jgi:putative hydrolase of the HAD superfamily
LIASEKYKAVIFDLFHTLTSADTTSLPGRGTSEILGVARDKWNEQLLNFSEDRLKGNIRDPYDIVRKLARAIDPDIPERLIREAADVRRLRFARSLRTIEANVLDALEFLKNKRKLLGLISNGDVHEVAGWSGSPLKAYFDVAIFSCHVGFVKPEKEIYELCIEKLGVVPEDCLYVGDGGSDELLGAKKLGMTTVMTTRVIQKIWPDKIKERELDADYIICELSELFT